MNHKKSLLYLIFAPLLLICGSVSAVEKVSLQLLWLHQFEFAGFYVAKEKGFYRDVGLDVEIKQHSLDIDTIDEVVTGNTNYGIGRTSLLIDRSEGQPLMFLKAIFQVSPLILLGKKSDKLSSIQDIKNKRVMLDYSSAEGLAFRAMLSANGIDYYRDIIRLKHTLNINSLVNNDTDLVSAYIFNEPYRLLQLGIEPIYFSPNDYGLEFYSDILFTSDNEFKNHPKRVQKFIDASIKGWLYAFENINQTAKLIYDKYNTQDKTLDALVYEGEKLKTMALYKDRPFGDISVDRLKRTYNIYQSMGLVEKELNIVDFVYQDPKTQIKKLKIFFKKHADNGDFIIATIVLILLLLLIVLWNFILKRKVSAVIKQNIINERLIFKQNRIKEMTVMMAGIAHQWRQPLANISANILNIEDAHNRQALGDGYLTQKLDNIENSITYMSATIDDFANYINTDSEAAEFNINDCITIALKLLDSDFLKHNIKVNKATQSNISYFGCRNELLQVLIIILNNAKDALINKKTDRIITINIKHPKTLDISIEDNGIGIKDHDLKQIFNPNFSTNNDRSDSGLGLYIAKSIINDRFCGDIKVSNKGKTIFTVMLGHYKSVEDKW